MKRKRINACFLCDKNGCSNECNGIRPCNVCIRKGHPRMCYGGTPQIAHTTSSVHKVNEHSSTNNTNSKPSTTPVSPSLSQESVNQMLLKEIQSMADDCDKLAKQVKEIQLENKKLNDSVQKLENKTNEVSLSILPSFNVNTPITIEALSPDKKASPSPLFDDIKFQSTPEPDTPKANDIIWKPDILSGMDKSGIDQILGITE